MAKKKKRPKAKVKRTARLSEKKKADKGLSETLHVSSAKVAKAAMEVERQLPDLEVVKRQAFADFAGSANNYYRGSDNKWHRRIHPK